MPTQQQLPTFTPIFRASKGGTILDSEPPGTIPCRQEPRFFCSDGIREFSSGRTRPMDNETHEVKMKKKSCAIALLLLANLAAHGQSTTVNVNGGPSLRDVTYNGLPLAVR